MYKKFLDGKKVICFDLDGTIVDSNPLHAYAFAEVLRKEAPDLQLRDVYGTTGEPMTLKWNRAIKTGKLTRKVSSQELVVDTSTAFLKLLEDTPLEPRPGFWDTAYFLGKELNLPLVLTTNSGKEITDKILEKLEINGVFELTLTGDDVKRFKPDPEIYNKTAKHFGVKPSELLVFEDSILGAQAAEAAGTDIIVIWDGQTLQTYFPKKTLLFVSDFEGLADSLKYTPEELVEKFKQTKQNWELQHQQTQKQPR